MVGAWSCLIRIRIENIYICWVVKVLQSCVSLWFSYITSQYIKNDCLYQPVSLTYFSVLLLTFRLSDCSGSSKLKTFSCCRTEHFSVLLSNVWGWWFCAAGLKISAASRKLCQPLRMLGKGDDVGELRLPASLSIALYMVCCCLGSLFRSGLESVSGISFSFTVWCTHIPTLHYSCMRICIAISSEKFFL